LTATRTTASVDFKYGLTLFPRETRLERCSTLYCRILHVIHILAFYWQRVCGAFFLFRVSREKRSGENVVESRLYSNRITRVLVTHIGTVETLRNRVVHVRVWCAGTRFTINLVGCRVAFKRCLHAIDKRTIRVRFVGMPSAYIKNDTKLACI